MAALLITTVSTVAASAKEKRNKAKNKQAAFMLSKNLIQDNKKMFRVASEAGTKKEAV